MLQENYVCSPSKDTDQPAYALSLTRAADFVVSLLKLAEPMSSMRRRACWLQTSSRACYLIRFLQCASDMRRRSENVNCDIGAQLKFRSVFASVQSGQNLLDAVWLPTPREFLKTTANAPNRHGMKGNLLSLQASNIRRHDFSRPDPRVFLSQYSIPRPGKYGYYLK